MYLWVFLSVPLRLDNKAASLHPVPHGVRNTKGLSVEKAKGQHLFFYLCGHTCSKLYEMIWQQAAIGASLEYICARADRNLVLEYSTHSLVKASAFSLYLYMDIGLGEPNLRFPLHLTSQEDTSGSAVH